MIDEKDYRKLVSELDDLIDHVGENETHPLAATLDQISALIEDYENANVPELSVNS